MIDQMYPVFGEEEKLAMIDYMNRNRWMTEGPETLKLEQMIQMYLHVKHCIMVNNGTISLSIALLALGIQPYDKVIMPAMTMIATMNAVRLIGAIPEIVDIDRDNLCLDWKQVKIDGKTKAIIYVTFNGRGERHLLSDHKIPIIQDAAQAMGSCHAHFGDVQSYSLSSQKIISTGQGGFLTTDNPHIYDQIKKIKDFGRSMDPNIYDHTVIGINSKFTDLQAVIGIEQMKKLPNRTVRKQEIYKLYFDELSEIQDKVRMFAPNPIELPWFVDIYPDSTPQLQHELDRVGIRTRRIYRPLKPGYPVAANIAARGLWLPSAIDITNEQIKTVCDKIKEILK